MKKGFAGAAWATLILGCYFNLQPSYGAQPVAAPTRAPATTPLDCTKVASVDAPIIIKATLHDAGVSGHEIPRVTQISINGVAYTTQTGDICFGRNFHDPVTITFSLGDDLKISTWIISKDSNGQVTANDSVWMIDYPYDAPKPKHPGSNDWPACVPKNVQVVNRDITFDFSNCGDPFVSYEYTLVMHQCYTDDSGHSNCIDIKLDPRIVNQPDGFTVHRH
jgi:hypothetical protein